MSNELKDIADKLYGYGYDGWQIISAEKRQDGGWNLTILPMEKQDKEGKHDNNK